MNGIDREGRDTAADTIILVNERLKVEVARPGTYYEGPRFDWTSFITQVTLDHKHTFLTRQDFQESKLLGGGLCSEFGLAKPIGYDEIGVGEQFPKLGVGLLTKFSDDPYFAGHMYTAEPYTFMTESGDDYITCIVEPYACHGYAARLEKTIRLSGQLVTVSSKLINTGSKAIHTHEYAHNFVCINDQEIGPDYELTFSENIPSEFNLSDGLEAKGSSVTWTETPEAPFSYSTADITGESFTWGLVHRPSKVGLSETVDCRPIKAALWGKRHVACPELFIDVDIEPGEEQIWTRRYEFFVSEE